MRVVTALGAHIFEFDTEEDATLVSTQLATLRTAPPASTSGPSSSQQQQQPGTGKPGDLPQPLKEQLLRENADLRTMYAALVRSGVLSEAEFWAGQRDLANRQHQAQQRPGMSNVISSLISAVADGKQNQVNYTLTRQQINAILAENPAVRRAYLANVPHNMPEAKFWQYYCKHQFALHAKRQRRLKGEKAADIDDEHAGGPRAMAAVCSLMRDMAMPVLVLLSLLALRCTDAAAGVWWRSRLHVTPLSSVTCVTGMFFRSACGRACVLACAHCNHPACAGSRHQPAPAPLLMPGPCMSGPWPLHAPLALLCCLHMLATAPGALPQTLIPTPCSHVQRALHRGGRAPGAGQGSAGGPRGQPGGGRGRSCCSRQQCRWRGQSCPA